MILNNQKYALQREHSQKTGLMLKRVDSSFTVSFPEHRPLAEVASLSATPALCTGDTGTPFSFLSFCPVQSAVASYRAASESLSLSAGTLPSWSGAATNQGSCLPSSAHVLGHPHHPLLPMTPSSFYHYLFRVCVVGAEGHQVKPGCPLKTPPRMQQLFKKSRFPAPAPVTAQRRAVSAFCSPLHGWTISIHVSRANPTRVSCRHALSRALRRVGGVRPWFPGHPTCLRVAPGHCVPLPWSAIGLGYSASTRTDILAALTSLPALLSRLPSPSLRPQHPLSPVYLGTFRLKSTVPTIPVPETYLHSS